VFFFCLFQGLTSSYVGGGDNFPLTQQTVRYLLSCYTGARKKGKKVTGWGEYINDFKDLSSFTMHHFDYEHITQAFAFVCTRKV
jgi:hypothetical protein